MVGISSSLLKANKLFAQALAMQPVDHLAELSAEQRGFYEQFWTEFKQMNDTTPAALYEAQLNNTKWTPSEWLSYPRITTDMTIADCAEIWREQIGH